jgi:hypothetical protein
MNNQKKGVRVYAYLHPDLYKRLKAAAKRQNTPISQIIGRGVQRVLNKK